MLSLSQNEGEAGKYVALGTAMKLSGWKEDTPHFTKMTTSQDDKNFDFSVYLI